MKRWIATLLLGTLALAQNPGGNITVSFKDDISTLDPAIGYDWNNWSIIKSLFDGLMDYEAGSPKLRPGLAEKYTVSKDGKTYTFTLRKGVKFHNGREVEASDFKYSLERTLNPKTQSPGASFFLGLSGAQAFVDGKATEVTGIKAPDASTVIIALDKPDASFLHKMAINFSFVVPKEAVEQSGADFGKNPVGTGAFKFKEWVLGQRLELEKNPDYYRKGRPWLDSLSFQIGLDPNVAYLRYTKGELDLLGDGIPPAKFVDALKDPVLKSQIDIGNQLQTGYITLNTQVKPLNDVRVRQALNMAINKARIARIINDRAVPANQVLPPAMPGYIKDYKGYAYDIAKAKALLKQAGFPSGFATVLYANNTDPNPRIAQAIQQDLAQVGVKVELKTLAQSTVIEAGGTKGQAPMIWSGGMAWIADYPDPNNFYWPILACASAVQGGWNWAWYCNKKLEAKAETLDAMVQPGQEAARAKGYSDLYLELMKDAPWIPVFHEKRYVARSGRMGTSAGVFSDPIYAPVNYKEIFVK